MGLVFQLLIGRLREICEAVIANLGNKNKYFSFFVFTTIYQCNVTSDMSDWLYNKIPRNLRHGVLESTVTVVFVVV